LICRVIVELRLDLRLLGLVVQALKRHRIGREVDAVRLLELGDHPVDDRLVEVVAAEVVVTRGRLDLEHAVAELEHDTSKRCRRRGRRRGSSGLLLVEPVRE